MKMTANDIGNNPIPEHEKIIWTSGDLKGLSIDFTYQEIEYSGIKSKIEYRKLQVLRYLIDHKGDYITGNQLNQIEEYNSIDMSKSISYIKSSFIKLLLNSFDKEKCENLYKQIIDKRKISGITGYCFTGENVSFISENEASSSESIHDNSFAEEIETIETAEEVKAITPVEEIKTVETAEKVNAITPVEEIKTVETAEEVKAITSVKEIETGEASKAVESVNSETVKSDEDIVKRVSNDKTVLEEGISADESEDLRMKNIQFSYFQKNWFMLFIFLYGIVMLLFAFQAKGVTLTSLVKSIAELPLKKHLILFLGLSLLPIVAALGIDLPIAMINHKRKTGKWPSSKELHSVVMYYEGRFDISFLNVVFSTICNLTGAMTVVSLIFYVQRVPGFVSSLDKNSNIIPLICIITASMIAVLYFNYTQQTRFSPARCKTNYILTRFHALLNVIYLIFSISTAAILSFSMFIYRKQIYSGSLGNLDTSFCLMVISAYSFLWFSSNSPMADKIDAIGNGNFLVGAPLVAAFSVWYAIMCGDYSLNCIMLFIIDAMILLVWFMLFIRKKLTALYKITSSTFMYVSLAVIILLIIYS